MKRSEFLKISLVLAGTHVLGCGDDDGGTDAGTDTGGGDDAGAMDSGGGDDAGEDDAGGDDAGGDDAGADDAGGDDAGEAMCSGDSIEADVSNNHGHTLTIPIADIIAGEERQYVTERWVTATSSRSRQMTSPRFAQVGKFAW